MLNSLQTSPRRLAAPISNFLSVIGLFAGMLSVQAGVLGRYTVDSPPLASTDVDAGDGITFTSMNTNSLGYVFDNLFFQKVVGQVSGYLRWSGDDASGDSVASLLTDQTYLSFSISNNSGKTFTLTKVDFDFQRHRTHDGHGILFSSIQGVDDTANDVVGTFGLHSGTISDLVPLEESIDLTSNSTEFGSNVSSTDFTMADGTTINFILLYDFDQDPLGRGPGLPDPITGADLPFKSAIDLDNISISGYANSLTVSNANDSGLGSLRQAVADASSGDRIHFAPALDGATILLTSGQILIDSYVEIDASMLPLGLTIDGNGAVNLNRIFEVAANTACVLDSLTLINGKSTGNGGAVLVNSKGDLTIRNSTLSGNVADGEGGAIMINNMGVALRIDHCTLSNNIADGEGGAIYSGSDGLEINYSTIDANFAKNYGGGIYSLGDMELNHSTVSNNSVNRGGGSGIVVQSEETVVFNNSTIVGNETLFSSGAAVVHSSVFGKLLFIHCTLSNPMSGDDIGLDSGGGERFLFNTIVQGTVDGAYSDRVELFIPSGNQPITLYEGYYTLLYAGYSLVTPDAMLFPLGNYGGPTLTMPPRPDSPAIKSGSIESINYSMLAPKVSDKDQRGIERRTATPVGYAALRVDIGAVQSKDWLVGADISAWDPNLIFAGSIYDANTVFPAGFDVDAANLIQLQSTTEKAALVTQGEANVTNNPGFYGLFTESAFQTLALDRPFLTFDPVLARFSLDIGILQAPDLGTAFTDLTGFSVTPYPNEGRIEIQFDAPNDDAHFYQLYGSEPAR